MEFRHLKTFDAVAALMSFNKAAEVLHCTQSTVSAQIKALEEDLGTPVFVRLGRRITLTQAGLELKQHTRRLLAHEEEIYSIVRAKRQAGGLLSLRVPQSTAMAYLPAILSQFQRSQPGVGFDISNCGYHHLAEELRTGMVDAAFLLTNALRAPDLVVTPVLTEPMVYVAIPGSGLAKRGKISLGDLEGQTLLMAKHDCGYRMQLEQSLQEAHVRVAALLEMNCLASLIGCLCKGLGLALLPRVVVQDEIAQGKLAVLNWKQPIETRLYLMRHRDKPLAGAFGAFIATAEAYFIKESGKRKSLQVPATQLPRGSMPIRYDRRL
jgi:DNA-binding transcriptional LysR family regulator